MEVSLFIELQDKLTRLAAQQGRDSSALVVEAVEQMVSRMANYDERFLAAVEESIAAAERGDFVEEEEMDACVEKMLRA